VSSTHIRQITLWLVIFVIAIMLWQVLKSTQQTEEEIIFSDFIELVKSGEVREVLITGQMVEGKYTTPQDGGIDTFRTFTPRYDGLVDFLRESEVRIKAKEEKESTFLIFLVQWGPMVILIGIWIFFMRQMQSGGNKALSFGKSKAKLLTSQQKKVTFADVAGVDEAKNELQEIIEFLKEPQKFQKLGGRIPKGVLLTGAPGTGKTLMARAIAGEANVPFFSISGSDFVEMFVGVGASRVRDLFEQGKKNAPCLIFIDEIDAVGRHRGAGMGGGHDEREQTLNQLLVEMDGFESSEGVILIAATNRPDVLDPALMRPGRFDRLVVVDRPDVKGREGILKVHTRKIPLAEDVQMDVLARGTPGFSGADLENLVNEAALLAARLDRTSVVMDDFEKAKDKVLMGTERKSLVISEEEKKNTAYHEAGHAVVAVHLVESDPIHKVTIIPRGRALGATQQLPIDDRHTYTKQYLENRIAILMGGRVSEEMFLDHLTTGAGDDLSRATDLVHKMVCELGMSELGPLTFGRKDEEVFLGRDFVQQKNFSESTAMKIDDEMHEIVTRNYKIARDLLGQHKDELIRVAEALLVKEVLDGGEINALVEGKTLEDLVFADEKGSRAAAGAGGDEDSGAAESDETAPDSTDPVSADEASLVDDPERPDKDVETPEDGRT
jgi:cell division protease FtsH